MKINLKNNDFLIWREPGKTHFQLYILGPASGDLSTKIYVAPFYGKTFSFGVAEEYSLSDAEVLALDFPTLTNQTNEQTSSKTDHIKLVAEAVEALTDTGFDKVVLSRKKVAQTQPKMAEWLVALAKAYPQSCAFIFHTKATGTWMGATPEILLQRTNNQVFAHSLAGTRLAAETGKWGAKEIDEQQIVTDEIVQNFSDFGLQEILTEKAKTKMAGPVAHLFTKVSAEISTEKRAIELAKKLHPTPAVGGLPQQKSINFIRERENYNRQFYTGFFGVEENKSARFYVNLRSMQLFKNGVVLYAGGGITSSSNPEAEWDETERKLQTLLQIIEDDKHT